MAIPETERQIYRERYEINSKLIMQNPLIEAAITSNTAEGTINMKKFGKELYVGEVEVTGNEDKKEGQLLEKDITNEIGGRE